MEFIIDFAGFVMPDDTLVVKELCVVDIYENSSKYKCKHFIFQPPLEYDGAIMQETLDESGCGHGIRWDSGETPYDKLQEVIKDIVSKASYIYVDGKQKDKWLTIMTDYSAQIIDIQLMRHYSFENVDRYNKEKCPLRLYHRRRTHACAFQNIQQLKRWFLEFWGDNPSYEKSAQIYYQLSDLKKMHKRDIACLDYHFLLRFARTQIRHVYDTLPVELQNNDKIRDYSFCMDHYPATGGDWDICGIWLYPYRKDCPKCINNSNPIKIIVHKTS